MKNTQVTYLRLGRTKRASGTIIAAGGLPGVVVIKPIRASWGHIRVTAEEIAAGSEKPPIRHRDPKAKPKTRQPRKPKPPAVPRWIEVVAEVRALEVDFCHPNMSPPVRMKTLTLLADELESAHARLAEFLPLTPIKP